tara:strand:- start:40 stop:480 length:441 start_codon:yes stop_codon:yes gene_type:complete
MKSKIILLTIALSSFLACSPVSAMAKFFEERPAPDMGLEYAGPDLSTVEPSGAAKATIAAIDTAGDAAGAIGIPFASYAGEFAGGLFSLVSLVLTAKLRESRKAAKSIVKGVEKATTDGTIKSAIQSQALKDGTASSVHQIVTSIS